MKMKGHCIVELACGPNSQWPQQQHPFDDCVGQLTVFKYVSPLPSSLTGRTWEGLDFHPVAFVFRELGKWPNRFCGICI